MNTRVIGTLGSRVQVGANPEADVLSDFPAADADMSSVPQRPASVARGDLAGIGRVDHGPPHGRDGQVALEARPGRAAVGAAPDLTAGCVLRVGHDQVVLTRADGNAGDPPIGQPVGYLSHDRGGVGIGHPEKPTRNRPDVDR